MASRAASHCCEIQSVPLARAVALHSRCYVLELLDINKDTPLEVTTDGDALIIRPVRKAPLMDRALAAADRLMDAHDETYRKLAK